MYYIVLAAWLICTLTIATLAIIMATRVGLWLLYAVFAMFVLISNVAAGKLIEIGPVIVPAVVVIYAVTFTCTDAICELYGKAEAQRLVMAGFVANILAIPLIYLVLIWPAAPINQAFAEKFNEVFSLAPRVIVASMVAYLASQTHDVWIYSWYKVKTRGRFMWFRNNASTIVSQLIDSSIFITLAFLGMYPLETIFALITYQWFIKVGIALADTPFLYAAVLLSHRLVHLQPKLSCNKLIFKRLLT